MQHHLAGNPEMAAVAYVGPSQKLARSLLIYHFSFRKNSSLAEPVSDLQVEYAFCGLVFSPFATTAGRPKDSRFILCVAVNTPGLVVVKPLSLSGIENYYTPGSFPDLQSGSHSVSGDLSDDTRTLL
jgi:hypothetical protein